MLHFDHNARLQLSREKAAELAREYRRAQKLESRSGASSERAPGLALRLRRRKAEQASARA